MQRISRLKSERNFNFSVEREEGLERDRVSHDVYAGTTKEYTFFFL